MENINLGVLIPLLFVLTGFILTAYLTFFIFRKSGLLRSPYNGMEWATVLWIGILALCQLCIVTALVNPTFQAYRTFTDQGLALSALLSGLFEKFSLYFILTVLSCAAFTLLSLGCVRLIGGDKKYIEQIYNGNLAIAVLSSAINISLALIIYTFIAEILTSITPVVLNFR